MKRLLMLLSLALTAQYRSGAQQVPKQIVVEHFTNTYCSVCANRNPGFYNNLAGFPQVLHIAYHPSSPYPACPLNQQNKPENDDRTNFYGVYGGTPRLVIQGEALPAAADYNAATIFSSRLGETSSFEMSTRLERLDATTLGITVMIRKTDTSSLASLDLYAVLAEDTLNFTGNNGETLQQDVFRKSFFGTLPLVVNAPLNVGDSVSQTRTLTVNSAWNLPQCYALAMVSTPDKKIVQASRSGRVPGIPTGIRQLQGKDAFRIYPVPAKDRLWLSGEFSTTVVVRVLDVLGKKVLEQKISRREDFIDLAHLPQGVYFLKIEQGKGIQVIPFSHR